MSFLLFEIISLMERGEGEREIVGFFTLFTFCGVAVSFRCLLFSDTWDGHTSVHVAYHDNTHLLFSCE